MNMYKPLTDKDIDRMMNMPAVCDLPSIDIHRILKEKLSGDSFSAYLSFVYKWGYLQGKRDIADWHGQTTYVMNKAARAKARAAQK